MTTRLVAIGDAAVELHRLGWPTVRANPPLHLLGAINLVFGVQGNSAGLLGAGWSAPEDGYCWAVGARSLLSLPMPHGARPARAYRLEIELAPFTAGTVLPGQRLTGSINGWQFTAPVLDRLSVLEVTVPADVMIGASIVLELIAPDAARPCDLIGGNDDRTLGFSCRRLWLEGVADAPAMSVVAPVAAADASLTDAALMLRFESLGENCEFGLVQRQAGVEPLGLLRFASAPLPHLLTALAAGFAGMGTPDRVTVTTGGDGLEYMIHDDVYGLLYHTGAGAGTDPVTIAGREPQRIRFLIDKLLGDLASADKIFVFHAMQPVRRHAANLLSAAIAQFGPATLLWVEPATDAFPCGTVQKISQKLFVGHLDRFAPSHDAHDFDYAGWQSLCRTCLVAHRQD